MLKKEETGMESKSWLIFVVLIAVWFVLNRWILPKFGIPT